MQIADVCCHLSISYSNQPTSLGYIANLMHRSTHDAQLLQFRIGDAKISDAPTQNAKISNAATQNAKILTERELIERENLDTGLEVR